MISTQLIYALILSVHLVSPVTTSFSVEVLEGGSMVDTVRVERRSGVYRYLSGERDDTLFEVERSGLYGQFFLVFTPGEPQPQVVDLSQYFERLSDLPVARDPVDVLDWRLRRGRGTVYLEMPDIATVLLIHSEGPPSSWIDALPREPWAR